MADLVLNAKRFKFSLKDPSEDGFYGPYAELFEACFGKRAHLDRAWFEWFNIKSPLGKNNIYLFENQKTGRFAASYGLFPIEAVFKGTAYPATLSVNGMTHPDEARQGLYSELIKRSLAHQKKQGRKISLSFPTQTNLNSTKGHLKIGWQSLAPIYFYEKTIRKFSSRSAPNMATIDRFNPAHDARLGEFLQKYDFYLPRGSSYLNWRFPDRPHQDYHIITLNNGGFNGYIVCKLFCDLKENVTRLHIVDFAYDQISHFKELLAAAANHAIQNGARVMDLWKLAAPCEELALLEDQGFEKTARHNELLVFSDMNFSQEPLSGWHLVLGDNDVF